MTDRERVIAGTVGSRVYWMFMGALTLYGFVALVDLVTYGHITP